MVTLAELGFKGYYYKIGEWVVPLSLMMIETEESTPIIMLDLDSYNDADGTLHRTVLDKHGAKFEFSTPPMHIRAKEEFMQKIRSNMIDKKVRKIFLEYYNEETCVYDTGYFYIPDFVFRPLFNTPTGPVYDSIRVAFISYVDNSNV